MELDKLKNRSKLIELEEIHPNTTKNSK